MAQRVITVLTSDLSGEELKPGEGKTVKFSYGGVEYTIDLTDKEAASFDKAIKTYVDSATRVGGRRSTASSGKRSKEELANIRSWWREQGNEIGDRGRVPQHIVDAYHEAH